MHVNDKNVETKEPAPISPLLQRFNLQSLRFNKYKSFFQSMSVELIYSAEESSLQTKINVDEEELIAVFMCFRCFYMKQSELNFVSVAQAILSRDDLKEHHDLTLKFLNKWKEITDPDAKQKSGLMLQIDSNNLSPGQNFNTWMNECYFHAENYRPNSNKGLDAIEKHVFFKALSKFGMIDMLQDLALVVIAFNHQVVTRILEENTSSFE